MVSTTILHEMPLYLLSLTNFIAQITIHTLLIKFDIKYTYKLKLHLSDFKTHFNPKYFYMHIIQIQADYL